VRAIGLEIPTLPVGKGRPRFAKRGGKVWVYTPEKTAHTEALIRTLVLEKLQGYKFPKEMPLRLEATFYLPRPKSARKRLLPTVAPDIDNYFKVLADSLARFAFEDDSQLTTVLLRKRYGDPGIHLKISPDLAED